jgi:hypothetical protein
LRRSKNLPCCWRRWRCHSNYICWVNEPVRNQVNRRTFSVLAWLLFVSMSQLWMGQTDRFWHPEVS